MAELFKKIFFTTNFFFTTKLNYCFLIFGENFKSLAQKMAELFKKKITTKTLFNFFLQKKITIFFLQQISF